MGMFDYFRSSYDIGEQFTNVVCQTKDIEDGIGKCILLIGKEHGKTGPGCKSTSDMVGYRTTPM